MLMQNRKGVSTTLAVAIVVIVIALAAVAYYFVISPSSSTSSTSTTSSSGALPGKGMSIGVVFDVGGLGDRGFNDLAYQGMINANKTFGVDYFYKISQSTNDILPNFEALIAQHVNLVVGVGFDMDQAIAQEAAKYPQQKFAQIDGDDYNLTNVVAVKFQENVGSALVGALAAAMTKTNNIGFVGGMSTGIIYKFWNGYKFGAEWAAKALGKKVTIQEQYTGPTPAAFNDPVTDQQIGQTMMSSNADIIYAAAGGSGLGLFNAVGAHDQAAGWNWSNSTAPPVFAIGVDANQDYYGTRQYFVLHENQTSFTGYTAPSFVLTSEIKKVDVGVFNVMKSVVYGNFSNIWSNPNIWGPSFFNGQTALCGNTGDQPCHVRNVYVLGLAQGAVGPTPMSYTLQYVPQQALNLMNQLKQGILNGTITVPEIYTDTGASCLLSAGC